MRRWVELLKEREPMGKRDEEIMCELGLVLEALRLVHSLQRGQTGLEDCLGLLLKAYEIASVDASASAACYETHLGRRFPIIPLLLILLTHAGGRRGGEATKTHEELDNFVVALQACVVIESFIDAIGLQHDVISFG